MHRQRESSLREQGSVLTVSPRACSTQSPKSTPDPGNSHLLNSSARLRPRRNARQILPVNFASLRQYTRSVLFSGKSVDINAARSQLPSPWFNRPSCSRNHPRTSSASGRCPTRARRLSSRLWRRSQTWEKSKVIFFIIFGLFFFLFFFLFFSSFFPLLERERERPCDARDIP
jgi:hypothetical protein